MVTFEELEAAPELSLKQNVDAFYDSTKCVHDFSCQIMVPLLVGLVQPSPKEPAIKDTYLRMHYFLGSVVALNELDHIQSVASATRSVFELWLDIHELAQCTTGDAVAKYHTYPEIERFRCAELLIKFSTEHPTAIDRDLSTERAFCSDPARRTRIASSVSSAQWRITLPKELARWHGC